MKLSIIVPVYNVEKYVERCLNSLKELNIENEIIVVNDGSTDNSLEVVEKFKNENPNENIIIISQENKGQAIARNRGIEISKGEYISFIDSDDFVNKEQYLDLIELTIKNKLDFGIGNIQYFYDENNPQNLLLINKNLKDKNIDTGISWILYFDENFRVEPFNKIYNREFLLENKLFFKEGRVHEDVIFTVEVYLKAKRVRYFDIIFYNYFQKNENSTMKNIKDKNYIDMVENIKEIAILKTKNNENKKLEKFLNELIYHFFYEIMEKTYKNNFKIFKYIQTEYRKIYDEYKIYFNMEKRIKRKSKQLKGAYIFIYVNNKLNNFIKRIKNKRRNHDNT